MLWVVLSLCHNSKQFLWCDMAHQNLLNNFLFIAFNNEAYILRYLKKYIENYSVIVCNFFSKLLL